jgi:hypothetical protein
MRKPGRCPKGHFVTVTNDNIFCLRCNFIEKINFPDDYLASIDVEHDSEKCKKRLIENNIYDKVI